MRDFPPLKGKKGKPPTQDEKDAYDAENKLEVARRVEFLDHLGKDSRPFKLANEAALTDYVSKYAKYWKNQPLAFEKTLTASHMSRVVEVKPPIDESVKSEIRFKLPIVFETGEHDYVSVFASKNRHDLMSLTADFQTPPIGKEKNSYVLEAAAFVDGLRAYTVLIGKRLLATPMFHGFNPKGVTSSGESVNCVSDVGELPNEFYDRHNAVHAFPCDGTKVVSPTEQVYAKIVALASYWYGTDLYGMARRADATRSRKERTEIVTGWERTAKLAPGGDTEKTLERTRKNKSGLLSKLDTLRTNWFDPVTGDSAGVALKWAAMEGKVRGPLVRDLMTVVDGLYDLVVNYGGRSEILKAADVAVPTIQAHRAKADIDKDADGTTLIDTLQKLAKPKHDLPPVAPDPAKSNADKLLETHSGKRDAAAKAAKATFTKSPAADAPSIEKKLDQLKELYAQAMIAKVDLKSNTVDL